MAGFVSSASFFSVNKLVFLLLFVLSSGYRGGRRGEIEGWLGLWQQLLLFLLFPEELYCGSAGWKRRRPDGRLGSERCSRRCGFSPSCKIPVSAPGGNCGDINEVRSSKVPCRRLSYCASSSLPAAVGGGASGGGLLYSEMFLWT